jgi:uncharacterized membrane protein YbhN (UPF0104 family)
MRQTLRRWWPVLKLFLALAVVAGVTWQFLKILRDPSLQKVDASRTPGEILWDTLLEARPAWLLLAAAGYLCGLGFSAGYWIHLLRTLGQEPKLATALRAYFIGHLGKYIPGKAWALLLRTTLSSGPGMRVGVAALTAAYETLTTMAAGALLAALYFIWQAADQRGQAWSALGLLALAGIPILPGVFNRLVRRIAAPFMEPGAPPLPQLRTVTLLRGLLQTACGWVLLGTSLWAVTQAFSPTPDYSTGLFVRCTAYICLAYVAGFLFLPSPGGVGVRELILQQLLLLETNMVASRAVVVVLLLRLLWTAAELLTAGVVYWLPGPGEDKKGGIRDWGLGIRDPEPTQPNPLIPNP